MQHPTSPPRDAAEPQTPRHAVYLYPGHLAVAAKPTAVTTILGTCVAVCLYDLSIGIGGLNHYLLTGSPRQAPSSRFGDVATHMLIARLEELGARELRMRAKVFGGMANRFSSGGQADELGRRNIEVAMKVLAQRSIPVVAQDVGGPRSRKLIFHTDTGDAWVRHF